MSKIIKRAAAIAAAVAIGAGGLAMSAPTADAAKVYKKPGSVTVKEGRKVIREADKQRCLTLKETRKIVKGAGWEEEDDVESGPRSTSLYWYGAKKSPAYMLVVHFKENSRNTMCADQASLIYDNGNVLVWAHNIVQWA